MRHGRLLYLVPWLLNQSFGAMRSTRGRYSASFTNTSSLVSPPQEPQQFYRRPLPASCIAFGTAEGRQIFKEALEMGFMEAFFDLVTQLRTQVHPSYCGLSAMVMVLNSFEMDPGRVWEAPWRWYHEEMLTCCLSSEDLLKNGITIDQFQSIAKCNGLNVDLRQPNSPNETVETFRSRLLSICSQSLSTSGTILVVSYDRKALKQTGSGHFALVGGYHPKRDLLLMLDTAAFKYPPHWAPLTAIYNGMCSLDVVTGRPRGYMLMTKAFHSRNGTLVFSHSHDNSAANLDERDSSPQNHHFLSTSLNHVAPHVNQLVNKLRLFCLADASYQAFSSPTSLLDPHSAGGRLRAVADEWSEYLSSTPLANFGKTCCCLLQPQSHIKEEMQDRDRGQGPGNCSPILTPNSPPRIGPAHRCECPCLVDTLLDHLLTLLIRHRPPDFFFSCQPLWPESSSNPSGTLETATQVIFELVSSATGRRARLALERLAHRSYEWLTSDSGGPLTCRVVPTSSQGYGNANGAVGGVGTFRRPACVLPLVADSKIRATALLTAFLLSFPYHTVSRNVISNTADVESANSHTFVEALRSSNHMLHQLPLQPCQTCFAALTPGTDNELTNLSSILAQLVKNRRPLGSRCIDKATH